jgi:hypothetical protein
MMKINSQIISEKVDKFIDVLLENKEDMVDELDAAVDEKLKYLEDDDNIDNEKDLDAKDGGDEVNPLTSKDKDGEDENKEDEVAECNKIK